MLVQFANAGVTEFNTPRFLSLLLQLGITTKAQTVGVQFLLGTRSLCELYDGKNGFNNCLCDQFLGGIKGVFGFLLVSGFAAFLAFLGARAFAEAATRACSVGLVPRFS